MKESFKCIGTKSKDQRVIYMVVLLLSLKDNMMKDNIDNTHVDSTSVESFVRWEYISKSTNSHHELDWCTTQFFSLV